MLGLVNEEPDMIQSMISHPTLSLGAFSLSLCVKDQW